MIQKGKKAGFKEIWAESGLLFVIVGAIMVVMLVLIFFAQCAPAAPVVLPSP